MVILANRKLPTILTWRSLNNLNCKARNSKIKPIILPGIGRWKTLDIPSPMMEIEKIIINWTYNFMQNLRNFLCTVYSFSEKFQGFYQIKKMETNPSDFLHTILTSTFCGSSMKQSDYRSLSSYQKSSLRRFLKYNGRHGIRTHARFYTPTAFPTQPLKPLE